MLALSSAHNHTTFCDGKSTAEEMVLSALSRGFVSLGFSGHAKQDFDHFYAMDEETEAAYIRQIRQLQSKYAGQIRLWLGMERDLYSNADRSPFDYVIGSVHYVPLSGGKRVPVDGPMDMVAEAVRGFSAAAASPTRRPTISYWASTSVCTGRTSSATLTC